MRPENLRMNEMEAVVRSSRRIENGVEIVERELHEVIKMVDGRYVTGNEKPPQPRLVISDESPSESNFIARRRSDIEGLEAFLRSIPSLAGAIR